MNFISIDDINQELADKICSDLWTKLEQSNNFTADTTDHEISQIVDSVENDLNRLGYTYGGEDKKSAIVANLVDYRDTDLKYRPVIKSEASSPSNKLERDYLQVYHVVRQGDEPINCGAPRNKVRVSTIIIDSSRGMINVTLLPHNTGLTRDPTSGVPTLALGMRDSLQTRTAELWTEQANNIFKNLVYPINSQLSPCLKNNTNHTIAYYAALTRALETALYTGDKITSFNSDDVNYSLFRTINC